MVRHAVQDMLDNPPWVTKLLAQNFEKLEADVPAAWLPKLTGIRPAESGRRISARLREYGCGAYGCVLPTLDPKIVLKVTSDPTEAEFARDLANTLVAPICVIYQMVMSLPKKHEGRPVYLLWRDAAQDVGELQNDYDTADLVDAQHEAAEHVFLAYREKRPAAEIAPLVDAWVASVDAWSDNEELEQLGAGLLEVWRRQRIFFGDLHTGNFGRVTRGDHALWLITDPGHIAVIR